MSIVFHLSERHADTVCHMVPPDALATDLPIIYMLMSETTTMYLPGFPIPDSPPVVETAPGLCLELEVGLNPSASVVKNTNIEVNQQALKRTRYIPGLANVD